LVADADVVQKVVSEKVQGAVQKSDGDAKTPEVVLQIAVSFGYARKKDVRSHKVEDARLGVEQWIMRRDG
jgi:hypothetical protein